MSGRKANMIERACEVCGASFYTSAYRLTIRPARFCSKKCQRNGIRIPLEVRFAKFLGPATERGCIPWTGFVNEYGYGTIGSGGENGRVILAHRASYELFIGPIPDGMKVLHRCDNPPCVNHEHLFLGTDADNKTDCITKRRHAFGERCGAARLTENDVKAIRERYANETAIAIAAAYGISEAHVRNIISQKRWKHV